MDILLGLRIFLLVWLCSLCCCQMDTFLHSSELQEIGTLPENRWGKYKPTRPKNVPSATAFNRGLHAALNFAVKVVNRARRSQYKEELVHLISHRMKRRRNRGFIHKMRFVLAESQCTKDDPSCKSAQYSRKYGPFSARLDHPLSPGRTIRLKGLFPSDAQRFWFSIRNSYDQHLLINLNLDPTAKRVDMNAFYNFRYSERDAYDQDIKSGQPLDVVVKCTSDGFEVQLNGVYYTFRHVVPYETATHIYGYGMVGVTETTGLGPLEQPTRFDPPLVGPVAMPIFDLPIVQSQRTIGVGGIIPQDSSGFRITLQTGSRPEGLAKYSSLWLSPDSSRVSWNYYFSGWGKQINDDIDRNLWWKGGQFYMEMVFKENSLVIFLNGVYVLEYNNQIPLESVTHLHVSEGLHVNIIQGLSSFRECSAQVWRIPIRKEIWLNHIECSNNRTFYNF